MSSPYIFAQSCANWLVLPPTMAPRFPWGCHHAKEWVMTCGGSGSKAFACNGRDFGRVSGSGRSSGEGNGYPLQFSCLENSMDRGDWQATVHVAAKSRTWPSDKHFLLLFIVVGRSPFSPKVLLINFSLICQPDLVIFIHFTICYFLNKNILHLYHFCMLN